MAKWSALVARIDEFTNNMKNDYHEKYIIYFDVLSINLCMEESTAGVVVRLCSVHRESGGPGEPVMGR